MSIKFVPALPETKSAAHRRWGPVRDELRQNPGLWAEVLRLPKSEYAKANNAGASLATNNPDIERALRTIGDEVVLFARAVAQ